ncbi:DapH/DapD/GlmU-related protein [Kitasatospora sp. NPDC048538]|uniref:acyltransferase n=1 Tax=unclassified Kitasatospora TaxID=2633591 RepID=UPI0033FEA22D
MTPPTDTAPHDGALVEPRTRTHGSTVGPGCWVRHGVSLEDSTLAAGVFIGFRSAIAAADFGPGAMVASLARVGEPGGARVTVGAGAWIAARAVVAPGVRLGRGAVVAAGAHVTRDVPDDTIVVGRPARILRHRTPVEDGLPDPSAIVALVRRRAPRAVTLPPSWRVGTGGLLDAEFGGGVDVRIGPGPIALGRPDGPSPLGGIRLGTGVRIGARAVLEAGGGLSVGDRTVLGPDVQVLSSGHDLGRRSLPWRAGPVSIGADVLIGSGVTVIGPCTIGDRARVADGAIVVGDVPEGRTTHGVLTPSDTRSPR